MNTNNPNPLPAVTRMVKVLTAFGLLAGGLVFVGAMVLYQFYRPYDMPEFADIDTSESAFLIPLDGDAAGQSAFPSVEFLNEKKVAAKRVQVPHRWQQMGRFPGNGQWVPTVRLIKVDRRPITREWTRHTHTGTASKDQAISVESKDSINLSMGVTLTANIPEDMAAVFLYAYPSKSLADMLDMEVRGRVQQIVSEECGKYELHELPKRKSEIMAAVRADVVPFFKERGIAITSIGMYGGLTYDNPDIQKAIDESAKAAQLKVVAEAKREAQEVDNKRLKMEAEGRAQAATLEAKGKADAEAMKAEAEARARLTVAKAEAEGIKVLADARIYEAEQASASSTMYLQLRTLEAETQRWKTWDGKFPTHWVNSASPFAALFPAMKMFEETTTASAKK